MIIFLLFAIFLIMTVFCVYGLYQNEKTLKDRKMIISFIRTEKDWIEIVNALGDISYDQHFWARMKMQDWLKLYPEKIQNMLR